MTRYVFIVALLVIATNLSAQNNAVSLEKAKQLASQNDKRIMLIFKGSDWCAPCIKLEKEILTNNEFKSLSKDGFISVIADFPRKKKNRLTKDKQTQNNALAEKYNPKGYFPYVVIISAQGKYLGSIGYEKTTPKIYFEKINAFK